MADPPQLLTISEAAEWLNISRTTMYRLINEGTIQTVKVGARQRVPVAEINRLVAESLEAAGHGSTRDSV